MKQDKLLTKQTAILVITGICLNLGLSRLALCCKLPLYLDSVGTILSAALGGYFPGVLVGFLSNVINSVSDPITLYYGAISVLIAMAAAYLSTIGAFRRLGTALLSALLFAVLGGILGSVVTWVLNGLNFGTGVSAPYVLALYQSAKLGKLPSEFIADFGVDAADKLLSVLAVFAALRYLPKKYLDSLPMGDAYQAPDAVSFRLAASFGSRVRRHSVKFSVTMLLLGTAVIVSTVAVSISSMIYNDMMNSRFVSLDRSVVSLVSQTVDGDRVTNFLSEGTQAEGYEETLKRLESLLKSFPGVEYLYVYQIREDGCHVVFDVDTPELAGEPVGSVIAFDSAFQPYLSKLLAGEEIDPVIENGQFGWLLTVYQPIRDSSGKCVAYAAADIAMAEVIADRYAFIVKMVSLLLGVTIIILAFTLWYAQRRLVEPIDALASVTGQLAYTSAEQRQENTDRLKALNISTGDEIENLYHAISKTTEDVGDYIHQIKENTENLQKQSDTIAKMQNNIILCFADMVENRDENTGSHIRRTAAYVEAIGGELLREGAFPEILTPAYLVDIKRSAPLHDIGKIKVSDTILNKPGKLTPEEFAVMKTHAAAGADILQKALVGIEDGTYLSTAIDMARHHHEWWNGRGYPDGLRGEEIPLCARIMAAADVLDALLSKRSYKEAYSFDEAMKIIREESGTHFDPRCVSALFAIRESVREITEKT